MRVLSTTLFFALLFVVSLAVETDEGVYVLTKDNFDNFVDAEQITLVEFYAPWCGHCKKLVPEYVKAAEELKHNEPLVKLAKVDATIESDLASRFGVSGYPTLKIFRYGSASEYKGSRDAAGIVSYMKKQAAPSITEIKSVADVEKFINEDAGVVYFGEEEGDTYKAFQKAAEKHRETYRFGKTNAKEVLDKYKHKDQVVILQSKRYTQSPLEKAEIVFQGADSNLASWIEANILPLVGELHDDNRPIYHGRDKLLVKVYQDIDWKLNPKGANYLLNRIRKVAKDFEDKFSFTVTSKSKSSKEIEDFGLKGEETPFGIHNIKNGHKFPAPESFTPEALKKLLEDYVAGKLEAYIKSEAVPEKQDEDGPVVVVAKTFDDIVLDPTKDVLIEAYAPWCGHCKQLEPKYKELAQKMKKYSDTLTIAKIDATANDLPPAYVAKGYPTIFFAPANSKDKPLTYDSQREVKDFENYIKRHASLPLKAQKKSDEKEEL